jgi:ubiquinone/menaquinone biosynthesis C-methylase UbiE
VAIARFYRDRVLPRLIDLAMRQDRLAPYRRRAIASASGRVLEIGVGSGINLPLYTAAARSLVGLEPSAPLLTMARGAMAGSQRSVALVAASAERLPFDDGTIDTVVSTWTLCSIPDVAGALLEMRRVLAADGRLLFVEHGRAPDADVARWQNRLTPLWRRVAGGCHLNRRVDRLLTDAGFRLERLDTGYMEGPRALTFMFEGVARPR